MPEYRVSIKASICLSIDARDERTAKRKATVAALRLWEDGIDLDDGDRPSLQNIDARLYVNAGETEASVMDITSPNCRS